eukprot:GHUV01020489.1.p2 GENE.GHUV01020489.1~~GHUV01020489.1.p2  ORF type:complete len:202 (+),score=77.81 GHUV01020489.1:119-724(+)
MLHAVARLLLSPLLRMTSTHRPAAVPAAASVSRRLRELADQLDAGSGSHSSLVAEELQLLAEQLLADSAPRPEASKQAATVKQLEQLYNAPAADKPQQQPLQHTPQQQPPDCQPASKKQKRAAKSFDFEKYRQRYVALQLMYVGWDYHGFARQADTDNTIEVGAHCCSTNSGSSRHQHQWRVPQARRLAAAATVRLQQHPW